MSETVEMEVQESTDEGSTDEGSTDPVDFLVGGRYHLIQKLKSSEFGGVFIACDHDDPNSNKRFAVKLVDNRLVKTSKLDEEGLIYDLLITGCGVENGIPTIRYFRREYGHTVLVMDLLGPSLEDLFNYCDGRLSLKTVLKLVEQMITRVRYLHSKGIMHRDITPDHFLMGTRQDYNTVYVIDFGLAIKYIGPLFNSHVPYATGKPVFGTLEFVSLNVHKGVEPGRRDDLESLGYVLIYLIRGGLPWTGIEGSTNEEKSAKILELKTSTSLKELCKDCPEEFVTYLIYCRNLGFEETPDYEFLIDLFRKLILSLKIEDETGLVFDWFVKKASLEALAEKNNVTNGE